MSIYVGCCCAESLTAQVQACIDQGVGLVALEESRVIAPTAEQYAIHYRRLTALLQAAVDMYTEQHGVPDSDHYTLAAEWLLKELRG